MSTLKIVVIYSVGHRNQSSISIFGHTHTHTHTHTQTIEFVDIHVHVQCSIVSFLSVVCKIAINIVFFRIINDQSKLQVEALHGVN